MLNKREKKTETPKRQRGMASGDSYLNTLTIDGRFDRSSNLHKFKDPMFFIRLPQSLLKGDLWGAGKPTNPRRRLVSVSVPKRRGQSATDRRSGHRSGAAHGPGDSPGWNSGVWAVLASLWLPISFVVLNAMCFSIEPSTSSLMLATSTLLLHNMGIVGRRLALTISALAAGTLLVLGSDMIYILAVHAVYYSAASMGKSFEAQYTRTKRPYIKK